MIALLLALLVGCNSPAIGLTEETATCEGSIALFEGGGPIITAYTFDGTNWHSADGWSADETGVGVQCNDGEIVTVIR
jgi:hypothetical protein